METHSPSQILIRTKQIKADSFESALSLSVVLFRLWRRVFRRQMRSELWSNANAFGKKKNKKPEKQVLIGRFLVEARVFEPAASTTPLLKPEKLSNGETFLHLRDWLKSLLRDWLSPDYIIIVQTNLVKYKHIKTNLSEYKSV